MNQAATRNSIGDAADAAAWVAAWIRDAGHVRPGILAAVVDGLRTALAIMTTAPTRYAPAMRSDLSEAIDYLTSTDWTDQQVCAVTP